MQKNISGTGVPLTEVSHDHIEKGRRRSSRYPGCKQFRFRGIIALLREQARIILGLDLICKLLFRR